MNSVCIATYNGERYIEEQLRSILVQIAPDDEVIVSDDGSTDRTVEIVRGIGDSRVRLYHSDAHYFRDNFANALRHAGGDIIFLSDQDDVWLSGKYEQCINALKEVDLVCTNAKETDEALNITNPDFFSVYHSGKGILKNIINNTYYGACMAFRSRLLEVALPFPPNHEIGHDVWLGLVAEMTGTVRFIATPYLLYRRHSANATSVSPLWTRSQRPIQRKLWGRIVMMYYVLNFYCQHGRKIG